MKKRDAGSIKRYVIGGAVLVLVILSIGLGKILIGQKQSNTYSGEYVAMKELPSQMSFMYYEEQDWEKIIKEINNGRNLQGKLTYGKLESLLKKLSLDEYITYEKKKDFQTVSRETWNQIYEQMLDLLDVNQTVTVTDFVFLGRKDKG